MRVTIPDNMKLRSVSDDDHSWLIALHNDPDVLHNITNPQKITLEHHMKWWQQIVNDEKQLRLIFTVDGERAGFAKFYNIDLINKNCYLGADLHPSFRGKGLSKYMWELMIQKCFEQLKLHRIALTTASYNDVGNYIYKKFGFKEEGRLIQSLFRDGIYYDQICMYMLKSDWE